MRKFWTFIFRGAGLALGVFAVVFMSAPAASGWKKIAGVACAVTGTLCFIAMYLAKKPGAQDEIHLVKRELEHYPPGSAEHHSMDGDHNVDIH